MGQLFSLAQYFNSSKWARNNWAAPLGLRCCLTESDQIGAQKAGPSQGAHPRRALPKGLSASAAGPPPASPVPRLRKASCRKRGGTSSRLPKPGGHPGEARAGVWAGATEAYGAGGGSPHPGHFQVTPSVRPPVSPPPGKKASGNGPGQRGPGRPGVPRPPRSRLLGRGARKRRELQQPTTPTSASNPRKGP